MDSNNLIDFKPYWQQSKFDENFNEVSYEDNRGTSFEFINPITGELKFFRNNNIEVSQKLLDSIKFLKRSPNYKEYHILFNTLSSLTLVANFNIYSNFLFFIIIPHNGVGFKTITMIYMINIDVLFVNGDFFNEVFNKNKIELLTRRELTNKISAILSQTKIYSNIENISYLDKTYVEGMNKILNKSL